MATSPQHALSVETGRERADGPTGPGPDVSRSFDPDRAYAAGPARLKAFADGTIEQARIGRVLLVSARDHEVGAQNWEPFARWLVDEVRTVNASKGDLILDLRRVDRLSSRGLRALALGWLELAEGRVIAVCGLNPLLTEMFAISHYDRLFEIYPDAIAAFQAVSGPSASRSGRG